MQSYHYVYLITNLITGQFYPGVRTSKGILPENDTKYWSSSKYLKKNIEEYGKENFTKEILSIFDTRQEAEKYERFLIKREWPDKFHKNPLMLNRHIPGEKFNNYGVKVDGKTKDKISEAWNKKSPEEKDAFGIKMSLAQIGNKNALGKNLGNKNALGNKFKWSPESIARRTETRRLNRLLKEEQLRMAV